MIDTCWSIWSFCGADLFSHQWLGGQENLECCCGIRNFMSGAVAITCQPVWKSSNCWQALDRKYTIPRMHKDNWKIKRNKNRSQDLRKVLVSSLGQLNLLRLHNRHQLFFFLKRQRKLGGGLIFFSPLACPRDFFFCPKKKPAPAMKARSFFVCQFKQNLWNLWWNGS